MPTHISIAHNILKVKVSDFSVLAKVNCLRLYYMYYGIRVFVPYLQYVFLVHNYV